MTSRRAAKIAGKSPARRDATIALADIKPNPRNARVHSSAQVAKIARLIESVGFTVPLIVDESMTVLAGHGRLTAAKKLGLKTLPCVVLSGLSEAQRRAYALADNNVALDATWDEGALGQELRALIGTPELHLPGFEFAELAKLLELEPAEDEQDASPQLGGMEFRVVVDCSDESHQAELLSRFEAEGLTCRPLIS